MINTCMTVRKGEANSHQVSDNDRRESRTDRQTERKIDRQTDRLRDGWTNRYTDR